MTHPSASTTDTPTTSRPLRILISGGGTGGHIFPALSIAGEIRRRYPDAEILFVGALGRMEMERVPAAGYRIIGLPVAGFDRKRLWRNFGVLIKLWRSMRMARRIIREFRPDIAVGVGGYASGPMLKRAQKDGIPTVIQEQNSYPGVTNKLLGRRAKAICVAYNGLERFFPAELITLTGNPVRANLLDNHMTAAEARAALGFPADTGLLLVTGGSLGATTINESMRLALPMLDKAGISVLWQTGKNAYAHYSHLAQDYPWLKIVPFISDMDVAYHAADLTVARAGAGTISELQLIGMPAVLIPSPNVTEDHQRKNAMALTSCGAAVMIEDDNARRDLGPTVVRLMADDSARRDLGRHAREMALTDSTARIVDIIMQQIPASESNQSKA